MVECKSRRASSSCQVFLDKVMEQDLVMILRYNRIIRIPKELDSQIISRRVKMEQAMAYNQVE